MIITSKVLQRLIDEEFSRALLKRQEDGSSVISEGIDAGTTTCPVCGCGDECDDWCPLA